MPTCSLIISTYNWPKALKVCFKSVLTQSVLPDEIIIADDGSREDTKELVASFQQQSTVPVVHVWQPDEGFQLAKIRNRAIAAAKHEYIIQIDGDLILSKHFIKDHLNLSRQSFFITGSRMLLSPEVSAKILELEEHGTGNAVWGNKNLFNSLRIPVLQSFFATRYKNRGKHQFYVKGCNMSFWKKDLLLVNGYNETFTGWGKEDSEIAIRLINAGIRKQFLKLGGVCYHIYHKEASREREDLNDKLMNDTYKNKITWIEKGISQYV